MVRMRVDVDDSVRALCAAGDFDAAATAAFRGYGAEVLGYLSAIHANDADAADVFAIFGEALWRGLPRFAWECSLRTWAYVLARHASIRFRKSGRRHAANVPLSQDSAVERAVQEVRTATASYLRTERRDQIRQLRDELPEEDKTLLVLRVDRGLAWDELARILGREGADPARESARLRKRFQVVKERLIAMGRARGLIKARKE